MEEIYDFLRKNRKEVLIVGVILSVFVIYQFGKRIGDFIFYVFN